MEQLRDLLTIHEMRRERLRAELAQRLAALAAVDEELGAVDDELAQIARQRLEWEHAWQRWLYDDRVLSHGQDYNLSHLALSAWERDARQARDEISARHVRAAAEVDEVRRRLVKAERRLEVLQEWLHERWRRQAARRCALVDSRSQDEARAGGAALRIAV